MSLEYSLLYNRIYNKHIMHSSIKRVSNKQTNNKREKSKQLNIKKTVLELEP